MTHEQDQTTQIESQAGVPKQPANLNRNGSTATCKTNKASLVSQLALGPTYLVVLVDPRVELANSFVVQFGSRVERLQQQQPRQRQLRGRRVAWQTHMHTHQAHSNQPTVPASHTQTHAHTPTHTHPHPPTHSPKHTHTHTHTRVQPKRLANTNTTRVKGPHIWERVVGRLHLAEADFGAVERAAV